MNEDNYKDIINMPHPVSKKHPHMPIADRAAQFSPFAALTGYNEVIAEASRLTDKKFELSENQTEVLNQKLSLIKNNLSQQPEITLVYFKADKLKEGGSYITLRGKVKSVNEYNNTLCLFDLSPIPINDIYNIEMVN